jgi:hypothetical protein
MLALWCVDPGTCAVQKRVIIPSASRAPTNKAEMRWSVGLAYTALFILSQTRSSSTSGDPLRESDK